MPNNLLLNWWNLRKIVDLHYGILNNIGVLDCGIIDNLCNKISLEVEFPDLLGLENLLQLLFLHFEILVDHQECFLVVTNSNSKVVPKWVVFYLSVVMPTDFH